MSGVVSQEMPCHFVWTSFLPVGSKEVYRVQFQLVPLDSTRSGEVIVEILHMFPERILSVLKETAVYLLIVLALVNYNSNSNLPFLWK